MNDVFSSYRAKLRTADEAVRAVKSGDWVDYTSNVGFPVLLDRALARRRDELFDVKLRGNLMFGPLEVAECDPTREHFCYNSWHFSAYERRLCDRGQTLQLYPHGVPQQHLVLSQLSHRECGHDERHAHG